MPCVPKGNKLAGKNVSSASAMEIFHPAVGGWFEDVFPAPTALLLAGWPAIFPRGIYPHLGSTGEENNHAGAAAP